MPIGSIRTLGSGRTDAGVHALGQVIKIELEAERSAEDLHKGLNALLPADIRVLELRPVDPHFHPIFDADWKEYRYYFTTRRTLMPFERELIVSKPYEFDYDLMDQACAHFVGEHDFQNYFCVGTETATTVRTILECDLSRHLPMGPFEGALLGGEMFVFRVRGTGFLKQMVRLMISALWEVGRGKVGLERFRASLKDPSIGHLGPVAPPQGLFLAEVFYSGKSRRKRTESAESD